MDHGLLEGPNIVGAFENISSVSMFLKIILAELVVPLLA